MASGFSELKVYKLAYEAAMEIFAVTKNSRKKKRIL